MVKVRRSTKGKRRWAGRVEPTDKDRETVRALLAYGASVEDCRKILSADRDDGTEMSRETFYKYFRKEIDTAAPEANAKVAEALFKAAVKMGNVNAQKFWLQCRAAWTPTEERKLTGDLPVKFTLNIERPKRAGEKPDEGSSE